MPGLRQLVPGPLQLAAKLAAGSDHYVRLRSQTTTWRSRGTFPGTGRWIIPAQLVRAAPLAWPCRRICPGPGPMRPDVSADLSNISG